MGEILDLVCLALYRRGPLSLNDLHFETGVPYPTLRFHLRLHSGDRYECARALVDGVPTRVWRLLDPKDNA